MYKLSKWHHPATCATCSITERSHIKTMQGKCTMSAYWWSAVGECSWRGGGSRMGKRKRESSNWAIEQLRDVKIQRDCLTTALHPSSTVKVLHVYCTHQVHTAVVYKLYTIFFLFPFRLPFPFFFNKSRCCCILVAVVGPLTGPWWIAVVTYCILLSKYTTVCSALSTPFNQAGYQFPLPHNTLHSLSLSLAQHVLQVEAEGRGTRHYKSQIPTT